MINRMQLNEGIAFVFAGAICIVLLAGCTLNHYHRQADEQAYKVVAEKSNHPRWAQPGFTIEMDPRSRYFEPYDQDRQPIPQDDPASHVYMHRVDGKKGWPHWHQYGDRPQLENPGWAAILPKYVETADDGEVVLTLDSSLKLAYIHSPEYQEQLETVYLSALDVTAERFRFDTQFFGGTSPTYRHLGRLRPGGETNTLQLDNDLELNRQFATAGDLLVGFANSFVWQFAGPNTNATMSLLNFSLVQPLLRGAGRDRALETLTRAERGMLANLRQLARFRRGFYTNVAIGTSGVGNVSRLGGFQGGTGLTGFVGTGQGGLGGVGQATGFGFGFFGGGAGGAGAGGGAGLAGGGAGAVGGFIGLLQSLQEIRNTQYSLDLQLRTLELLEANLEAGTIDLTQVDQFRQNIETLRAQLLQARTGLQGSLDTFKTGTLGLPPHLPVELDDQFIAPFQLIDPAATTLQQEIVEYQARLGALPPVPASNDLAGAFSQARQLLEFYGELYRDTGSDIKQMTTTADERMERMEPAERQAFQRDLALVVADHEEHPAIIDALAGQLQQLEQQAAAGQLADTLRGLVIWTRQLSDQVQSLILVQARARLESITLETVELRADRALNIARAYRLDYMNNRAALVDSYRLIAFNADQLQSVLDVRLDGDIQTRGNNPIQFRAPTGSLTASLEFDAPFTRLLERNNYRQALVDYQQSRRALIQFDDQINQSLRTQLRNLQQLETNLEIQRRAVIIAIRRVDFTRAELNRPLPPAEPGAAATTFGPTAVQNLLSALSDLSNAQNNFMSVWLNYYAGRMALMRDLGIMQLDEHGRWIDRPLDELLAELECAPEAIPPEVPQQWWETLEKVEELPEQELREQMEELPPATPPAARSLPAPDQPAMTEKRRGAQPAYRTSLRDWGFIGETLMQLQ